MFIIHIIVLVILTIAFGIGTAVFTFVFYNDTYATASGLIRSHPKWLAAAVVCFGFFYWRINLVD